MKAIQESKAASEVKAEAERAKNEMGLRDALILQQKSEKENQYKQL